MKSLFLLFILLFGISACNDTEEKDPEFVFTRKIEALQMESFNIPDSINTSLILATFYNAEYDIQSLLVYADTTKQTVLKIDYLADSTSIQEELEILKIKEFRSTIHSVEYVIGENTVTMIKMRVSNGPLQRSKSFRRTDRD